MLVWTSRYIDSLAIMPSWLVAPVSAQLCAWWPRLCAASHVPACYQTSLLGDCRVRTADTGTFALAWHQPKVCSRYFTGMARSALKRSRTAGGSNLCLELPVRVTVSSAQYSKCPRRRHELLPLLPSGIRVIDIRLQP